MGIVRMIFLKNKAGIGRLKLTEVDKLIFGGFCRSGCMHK